MVFRAVRERDQRRVIIKMLREDPPSERTLARVEVAWNIGSTIRSERVIEHLELLPHRSGLALVTEDYGATSLRELIAEGGLELPRWLDIAVALCRALVDVHQHRVIHKDIKPANAVLNPETGTLKLIDFGLSHRLSREDPVAAPATRLEGTLPYISPEQTGRMNRSLDHRSDLYSLGVSLYELLSGSRPFEDSDAVELIHAHLTRLPAPVTALRPEVPPVIAELLDRLLAKTPEDRYQSAFGVLADLERCRDELARSGTVERFALGQRDLATTLHIPERLYGRGRQVQQLLSTYEAVAGGGRALALVEGRSGVGKTALIRELYKPVTASRGRFCAGKFDQYHRDIPYQALAGALRGLLRQVLTEPGSVLDGYRERLREALGQHGAPLVELLPELELLTGALPEAADLGPTEARLRFHETWKRFLGVFARPRAPLVLFLDDLQWADLPSLELIEVLLGAESLSHLLIIGAFRDNEVPADHPLRMMIRELREAGLGPERIALEPLDLEATGQLLAEALLVSVEEAGDLARVVHQKTGGNPFFVGELLRALARDERVVLDPERGRWTWELASVSEAPATDNVIELLADNLSRLPPDSGALLPLAACLGNTFDLGALLAVARLHLPAGGALEAPGVHALLEPALIEGMLLPMGEAWRRAASAEPSQVRYRFRHDRVQQAALAQLSGDQRARVSLDIARLLLGGPEARAQAINIASHFELASALLTEPSLRETAARAHLEAGRRALAALALEPALHYLRLAYDLLPDGAWSADYRFALDVHTALVDAEMRAGDSARGEALGEAALARARDPLDVMPIYAHLIQERTTRLEYTEALRITREALASIDIHLPERPGKLDVMRWLVKTRLALRRLEPEDLVGHTEAADPRIRAAQGLLITCSDAAYYTSPEWSLVTSLEGMRLAARHGVTEQTPYSCAMYALVQSVAMSNFALADRFARAGYGLLERFGAEHLRAKMVVIDGGFVRNWLRPLRENLRYFFDGWRAGVDYGDITYASYTLVQASQTGFASGVDLPSLLERFRALHPWLLRSEQAQSLTSIGAWVQVMVKLSDPETRSAALSGEWIDAEAEIAMAIERGEDTSLAVVSLAEGTLAYLLGDTERAWRRLAQARAHAEGIAGMLNTALLDLYQGLTAAGLVLAGDPRAAEARKVLARCRKGLARWARLGGPQNRHRAELLEALWLRAAGRPEAAMRQHRIAAEAAREQGFIQNEALAWSLQSELLASMGFDQLAEDALARAVSCYRRWGAHALAVRLQGQLSATATTTTLSTEHSLDGSSLSGADAGALDLHSVLSAARSISKEIDLPVLLERVMDALLRGAGAERGVLLLRRGDQLEVGASGGEGEGGERWPRGPVSWVRRSREALVLRDARSDELFSQDPEVQALSLRSVLVAPILHKGDLIGVIYLENNLAPGMFTRDRLEAVRLLASQAAVSIQNSWLFEEQDRLLRSFHRFVPEPFLEHLGLGSVTEAQPGDAVQRQITVLFSDIRGFTSMAERRSPRAIFDLLNTYFEHMTPAIERHGGFIDKFIGDAIMALFPGPPVQAVLAALEMQRQLDRLNKQLDDEHLATGVGLHTGPLTLGTIGTARRMETTVIGDTVNLAARLEGLTKHFGARVLLSGELALSAEAHPALTLRLVGRVRAVGKTEPTALYELLEAEPPEVRERRLETLEVYHQACEAFHEGRLIQARAWFRLCWDRDPQDTAARRYLDRCTELADRALPEGWDGVEDLLRK